VRGTVGIMPVGKANSRSNSFAAQTSKNMFFNLLKTLVGFGIGRAIRLG